MSYNYAMQIIQNKISADDLHNMANKMFGNLVKAVVDVELNILAIDAELHADIEQFLLKEGSKQSNLWGINLHPDHWGTDKFIEFDSMINLKPNQNNLSRDVKDPGIRNKITEIITLKTK